MNGHRLDLAVPKEGHAIDDVDEHVHRIAAVVARAKTPQPEPGPRLTPTREEHHAERPLSQP